MSVQSLGFVSQPSYLSLTLNESDMPGAEPVAHATIVLFVLYVGLIDGTAYATCLLSVTRAICIAFPFYQIKGKFLVIAGITVFITVELAGPTVSIIRALLAAPDYSPLGLMITDYLMTRIVTTSLMILVVVSATLVAVYKLTRKDLQGAAGRVNSNNRKASWTVVILSTLFFAFNFVLLVVTGYARHVFNSPDKSHPSGRDMVRLYFLAFCGMFVLIPLNSTLNPAVYLARKSDMQLFFKQKFTGFFRISQ